MRILLIRHGTTDLLGHVLYGRMPGVHLNEKGRRQAKVLAEAVKSQYRIDQVVSSPLERAVETAQFLADAYGLQLTLDEGINELDVGSWLGKAFTEIFDEDRWRKYNESRSLNSPPGGEFITNVQTRAWSAIQTILNRHQHAENATVAVVSHGDVIRALLLLLLGMPIDHIHRLEVAPASMSEVLVGDRQPRVLRINQVF